MIAFVVRRAVDAENFAEGMSELMTHTMAPRNCIVKLVLNVSPPSPNIIMQNAHTRVNRAQTKHRQQQTCVPALPCDNV